MFKNIVPFKAQKRLINKTKGKCILGLSDIIFKTKPYGESVCTL